jgi:hypothetical protein
MQAQPLSGRFQDGSRALQNSSFYSGLNAGRVLGEFEMARDRKGQSGFFFSPKLFLATNIECGGAGGN